MHEAWKIEGKSSIFYLNDHKEVFYVVNSDAQHVRITAEPQRDTLFNLVLKVLLFKHQSCSVQNLIETVMIKQHSSRPLRLSMTWQLSLCFEINALMNSGVFDPGSQSWKAKCKPRTSRNWPLTVHSSSRLGRKASALWGSFWRTWCTGDRSFKWDSV